MTNINSNRKNDVNRILLVLISIFSILYGVFYPVLSAQVSIVDDQDMIDSCLNSDISIRGIFFPHSHGGGYYRPLIGLSYFLDKKLWLMDSGMMHQENLLLHICNVFLLFFLARQIISIVNEPRRTLLSGAAALFFGLHPITVESVAWISGRTDLLATTFVLASANCLVYYRDKLGPGKQLASFFLLLPGMLAKEVSFGFLPVLFLFNRLQKSRAQVPYEQRRFAVIITIICTVTATIIVLLTFNHWAVLVVALVYWGFMHMRMGSAREKRGGVQLLFEIIKLSSVLAGAAALFYLLRRVAFVSDIPKIGQTITLIFGDTNHAIQVFLGAAGFYLKKYLFPVPLNFYIKEIDPLYSLLGIGFLFFAIYVMYQNSEFRTWFIAGIAMFFPSLPFAFGTIAWTSYAERYIYTTAAFWSICMLLIFKKIYESMPTLAAKKASYAFIATILILAAWVSNSRANLWRTNISLMRDTVQKSPTRKILRGIYMTALMKEGMLAEAKEQYRVASGLYEFGYDPRYELQMAEILLKENKISDAESYMVEAIERSKGTSSDALTMYINYLKMQISSENSTEKRSFLSTNLLENMQKLYELKPDPYVCFRMGQVALANKKSKLALQYFSEASKRLPEGSELRSNALRIVNKLSMQSL